MDSSDAEVSVESSTGDQPSSVSWTALWVTLVTAMVVVAADQWSKSWAVARLAGTEMFELLAGLEFRLAYNTGMAFSQGEGAGALIGILAVAVAIGIIIYSRKIDSVYSRVLMGVVAGGALGNVADRLFRPPSGFMKGAVVDFIYTGWWPTFNIADSAVVIGSILLVIQLWRAPESHA